MSYSFQQVCGFFNVPQSFRVEGIVRRDLRLIVLIREDLKVLPFADVITKAALSPPGHEINFFGKEPSGS